MALPTIISISEDAISAVPREYKEGSLAIGATRWQTIRQVIVPAALSGIAAAIILGIGRAIGETMAVLMVAGNAAIIPDPIWNVLSPIRTLTGTIGIEMGEVPVGSSHYSALFGVAIVLLIITLIINLSAVSILSHLRERRPMHLSERIPVSRKTIAKIAAMAKYLALACVALFVLIAAPLWLSVSFIALIGIWYAAQGRLTQGQIQKIAFAFVVAAAIIVIAILAIILEDIVVHGLPAISW
jgi:phosphate transport system permease protein